MTKRFISLLLITLILGSCAPAPVSLIPQPTVTVAPSRTPLPTQTAIPAATPYPPLQTDGPYLLFTYDNKNFTIMDADGSGKKQFQLPNDGYTASWRLEDAVSPDGKWLAYFTGSIDKPYNLALNLLDLKNETTFPVANLIAPGFPENIEPVTKVLRFENCSNTECKTSLFRIGLMEGIESLGWSPDSKLLAFSAQIDSFSSDIYIFSIRDKTITRLTNEPENIYRIFWSPSGEKILYDASIEGSSYSISTIWHLADLMGAMPQNSIALTEELPWRSLGWFNEDLYFISTAIDSPVYVNTGYIDIDSKETKIIWPYIAESMTLDSENDRIILSFMPYEINNPEITAGTYLLYLDGAFTKITNEFFYLFPEQISFDSYLATGENSSLVSISPDGSITNFAQKVSYQNTPRVSPDKRWVIIRGDNVTKLFSKSIQLIKSWDIDVSEVIWRPDSTGTFLYDRDKLYYLTIPDGIPISIDVCISKDCWLINYVWLH